MYEASNCENIFFIPFIFSLKSQQGVVVCRCREGNASEVSIANIPPTLCDGTHFQSGVVWGFGGLMNCLGPQSKPLPTADHDVSAELPELEHLEHNRELLGWDSRQE